MWIDTHCHLDAPEFAADVAQVAERARRVGVDMLVLPAVAADGFDAVRGLAHAQGFAYALGIHPLFVDRAAEDDLQRLDEALGRHRHDPRLVAVGEIGLDHFVPGLDRERQRRFYVEQLRLARRHALPVLLHVRRSADALLRELRRLPVGGGIAHAFNGSAVQAKAFVDLGFRLGFGGTLTFERALQIRRVAAALDPGHLVLETDAPDIPPQWLYRPMAERLARPEAGSPRNEPAQLPRIAESLAGLRGWTLQATAQRTRANALAALPRLVPLLAEAGAAAARRPAVDAEHESGR